ncbi:hypothetical protein A3F65_03405 [Candidatus Saccharibacteria bacterium RIFCSPHIGHO2_12_FULL_47_16b]|nr:MAG: hypothetical protein A3F65_03405 [Candidatus Saccharibacteria bacterium RIFCSPHIGHO2_12_FULL_47_16b]
MLQLSKSLTNVPIISLRLGGPVAIAVEPILNPHNLKVLGWWCKSPGSNALHILLVEDVRQVTPSGLAVNDESELSSPNELIRHKPVLNSHFELIGKEVKTKRHKLGKVSDYSYETNSMLVIKLYVARPLTKLFSAEDTLIIDRTQIIEITDHYILVKDTDVKVTEEEMAPATEAAPAA